MQVNPRGTSGDNYEDDEDIEKQLNRWWQETNAVAENYWQQKQLQGKAKRNQQGNEEILRKYGLPKCNSFRGISQAMEVDLEELRLLVFSPKLDAATKHHYIRFYIPKKTGGERVISAPTRRLKDAQYWILNNILKKLDSSLHDAAHGFRSSRVIKTETNGKNDFLRSLQHLEPRHFGNLFNFWRRIKSTIYLLTLSLSSSKIKFGKRRSIVTNAEPHVGADVLINIDIKDFFPSISYRRVKGLFKSFGYSESASTIFGLLCTVTFVNHRSYLPQGAPTSPMITNLICRRLDRRLTQMGERFGFRYTRYADDLTFSASNESLCNICNILRQTESIVRHEGFEINKDKTRILRKCNRLEVTGIVVNSKLSISRQKLKRFRATLYQIEKDGLEGKHWGKSEDLIASIQGFANFVYMVDPEKGAKFREQIRIIKEKHGC
ncbi:RNA-directed DNA polymerase [Scytonema sp. HK-05]|uniref:reverse transcriptase family protein n=1 Tax=Scytonema sp. HK-05 TaxID=1137095 RepID=UPI0009F9B43A|nr:reverse transcriptase family protein [Scytonema sp. HK-05]BAY46068.1 RNA-directed DNA polymerase [Scytonema sp. HK-05]